MRLKIGPCSENMFHDQRTSLEVERLFSSLLIWTYQQQKHWYFSVYMDISATETLVLLCLYGHISNRNTGTSLFIWTYQQQKHWYFSLYMDLPCLSQ